MGRLEGRVAVVTGGGDGIGAAVCRLFAAEGAKVVVADRDVDAARAVLGGIEERAGTAMAYRVDVGRKEEVVAMVTDSIEAFGTVDILVNNAWGGGSLGRLEHKTDEVLEHGMRIAYYGPFWAMQAVFSTMRQQRRGNIINLCSLNGVNAHVGTAEYNCAKEALRALTRTAAREWAPYGIVANALCPAAKTAAFRSVARRQPDMAAVADAANPMGRLGDADADIAPVAVFLASDDARYLTGNTLFVDGGAHINGVAWAPDLPDEPK
jgi:NAD(P)-dependent dehydrogenase (short-subunit alcohol dehydrogenase family)